GAGPPPPADDARREPTETSLAAALRLLARYDDLEQLTRQALARRCGPEHTALMTWSQALALVHTRPQDALSLTANPMLGHELDERWGARLGALRALTLGVTGHFDEVGGVAARALTTAKRTGDRLTAGYAWYAMAIAASRSDASRATDLTGQALVAAGDDLETAELRLALLSDQTRTFDALGLRAEAEAALRTALALAGRMSTSGLATVRLHAATHWFEVGRWDEALTAVSLIDEVPDSGDLLVRLHGLCALIAGHRDDHATAQRHLN